ncbi:hypothetical protein D3C81_2137690 [compost metagenome]
MLDAVDEEHALGVVVQPGVQRQVKQHHPRPEQDLARARHMVDPPAAHEQHDGDQEGSHQRGRKLPGYEPFETIHAGHPKNDGERQGSARSAAPRRL